jgi:hypothetical protein
MKPTPAALMIALGLGSLPILAALAQSRAPAWTPPAAHSPLRPIWSFDTKG